MKISTFPTNTSPRFAALVKPENEAPFKALIKAQYGEEAVNKFDPNYARVYELPAEKTGRFQGLKYLVSMFRLGKEIAQDIKHFANVNPKGIKTREDLNKVGIDGFLWVKVPSNPPGFDNPSGRPVDVILTLDEILNDTRKSPIKLIQEAINKNSQGQS